MPVVAPASNTASDSAVFEIIQRALEVSGGADRLKQFAAYHSVVEGTMSLSTAQKIDYVMESDYQYPDRFKQVMRYRGLDGKNQVHTYLVKEGEATALSNGKVRSVSPTEFGQLKASLRIGKAARLTDFLKYESTLLPPERVQGRLADGVRFREGGEESDVLLYFDRQTGRPAMVKFQSPTPDGAMQRTETTFFEYDVSEGITYPKHSVSRVDGRVVDTQQITQMVYFEHLEDEVFIVGDSENTGKPDGGYAQPPEGNGSQVYDIPTDHSPVRRNNGSSGDTYEKRSQ